ncbi:hypothetical protein AGMMS49938_08210 [Fibrobacterales bacterium]|nr:hypothetical protein AGMMS49938_08210 [Fibrobacterales bacterium]
MQAATIKKIENYLTALPDSAEEQIISFVGYLNYVKENLDYPYSDEKQSIEQYKNGRETILDWDSVRTSL